MTAAMLVGSLLAFAVLLGSARLAWGCWRQAAASRPRAWRVAILLLAQAAGAVLLYCVLVPPQVAREAGTLVVLTARTGNVAGHGQAGEHLVALPEAIAAGGVGAGVERVPDLATALRRYPATTRIHVLGAGLVARDRDAATGLALAFSPATLPRGLVELQAPTQVPAGRRFAVAGRGESVPGGVVELLDPAGRRIERAVLAADGRFQLHGSTRSPGTANFRLRLRDAAGKVVEEAVVPLEVVPARILRVLLLAGAPNAELKYLRRWTMDAGMRLDTRISLGGGVEIGSASPAFGAASLAGFDLVVLDERSWRALAAGQRAAVAAAVDHGLGLLLRFGGSATGADRERLRGLGFTAVAAGPARETRLGAGFARAGDAADALPTLTRGALRIAADDGVVLLADAGGVPLGVWRARGRGRVGVTTLVDSYRLVLGGRGDAHGEAWSRIFSVLARPGPARPVADIEASVPHQRSTICGVGPAAVVGTPGGDAVALAVDPASGSAGCAGFWPERSGWHALRDGDRTTPFFVPAPAEGPARRALALREATQALVAAAREAPPQARQAKQAGPRWPWFLAWLLLATAAWWFERSRYGLPRTPAASA